MVSDWRSLTGIAARRRSRAPQRICRKFAGRDAPIGIAFRAQQQRAVFEPEDLGFLGWIAVDFIQRRAIGHRAGARDLRCTGSHP